MLRGRVRADRDEARDRDDVDDVRALAEARQERAQAPDRAEVVRVDQPFDRLRVGCQEVHAPRAAGVVGEQVDPRVALEHACSRCLDGFAVGDVAGLVLVGVGSGAARKPDRVPAAGAELAAERRADPRRGSRDDGDTHPGATVAEAG